MIIESNGLLFFCAGGYALNGDHQPLGIPARKAHGRAMWVTGHVKWVRQVACGSFLKWGVPSNDPKLDYLTIQTHCFRVPDLRETSM